MMLRAESVREEMNRKGESRTPFLFGVDFEMNQGFFFENPLRPLPVQFFVKGVGNSLLLRTKKVASSVLSFMPEPIECYARRFSAVRQALLHGDSFLLNLTVKTPVDIPFSLENIFQYCESPYKLYIPGRFVCFSPESFVEISDGFIRSFPMKGTIDASLPDAEKRLIDDEKELGEHYTIVDLIRNDLNRVAEEVQVVRFRYIDRIHTMGTDILQTSTEIEGRLNGNYYSHLGDIIFELLPAGSVSGAPKEATLSVIRKAEEEPRGFYCGVFGYFDGRKLQSAVLIRYIEEENGCFFFRSGGGITINSRLQDEYEEVMKKIYLPVYQ